MVESAPRCPLRAKVAVHRDAARILQHARQMQQVPRHERRVALRKVVLRPPAPSSRYDGPGPASPMAAGEIPSSKCKPIGILGHLYSSASIFEAAASDRSVVGWRLVPQRYPRLDHVSSTARAEVHCENPRLGVAAGGGGWRDPRRRGDPGFYHAPLAWVWSSAGRVPGRTFRSQQCSRGAHGPWRTNRCAGGGGYRARPARRASPRLGSARRGDSRERRGYGAGSVPE